MTDRAQRDLVTKCPAADLLRRVAEGVATAAEEDGVARHLDGCEVCRRRMDGISGVAGGATAFRNAWSTVAEPGATASGSGVSLPGTGDAAESAEGIPQLEGYRIEGRLGEGGMGTVWRAEQLSTKRMVALKFMSARRFSSPKARMRFEREVELSARLEHPNIARIYDSGLQQGVYYYAMECIEGSHLDAFVRQHALIHRHILALMIRVCRAVQFAHQRGVIHRDLKPSNIMVTRDAQPRVLDFGLARSLWQEDAALNVSMDGEVAGTPAYMSPEQAAGKIDQIDTRSDVYTLGVILFELLTGQLPRDMDGGRYAVMRRIVEEDVRRPRQVNPRIDSELESLLLKSLARDAKDRYTSAGELAADIRNYLAGDPLTARPATTTYFLRKRLRKHRVPLAIAASILAVLLSMVVLYQVRLKAEKDRAQAGEAKATAAADKERLAADKERLALEALQAQQDALVEAKNKAEREAYLANVAFAQDCLFGPNPRPDLAYAKLGACPAPLRGFEWKFMWGRLVGAGSTLKFSDTVSPIMLKDKIALTPDGMTAAVLTGDGHSPRLEVFRRTPGKSDWEASVCEVVGGVWGLVLDVHGKLVVVRRGDQIEFYDAGTLKPLRTLPISGFRVPVLVDSVADILLMPNSSFYRLSDGALLHSFEDSTPLWGSLPTDRILIVPNDFVGRGPRPFCVVSLSGEVLTRFEIPADLASGLTHPVLSNDGRFVIVLNGQGIHVLRTADSKVIRTILPTAATAFTGPVDIASPRPKVIFSPNGDRFMVSCAQTSKDGVRTHPSNVYELTSGYLLGSFDVVADKSVFSPDGGLLAISHRGVIQISAIPATGIERRIVAHTSDVTAMAFLSPQDLLVSVSADRLVTTPLGQAGRGRLAGAFTRDGGLLDVAESGIRFTPAELVEPGIVHGASGIHHNGPRTVFVTIGPDNKVITTWGPRGEKICSAPLPQCWSEEARAFSRLTPSVCPSGRYFFLYADRGAGNVPLVALFETSTLKDIWTAQQRWFTQRDADDRIGLDDQVFRGGKLFSVADGSRTADIVAAISDEGTLCSSSYFLARNVLYDRRNGNRIKEFSRGEVWIGLSQASFDPGERYLAIVTDPQEVSIYDLPMCRPISVLKGSGSRIVQVCMTHDAQRVATMDTDKMVTFWELCTGREVARFPLGATGGGRMTFSGDDLLLFISGQFAESEYLVKVFEPTRETAPISGPTHPTSRPAGPTWPSYPTSRPTPPTSRPAEAPEHPAQLVTTTRPAGPTVPRYPTSRPAYPTSRPAYAPGPLAPLVTVRPEDKPDPRAFANAMAKARKFAQDIVAGTEKITPLQRTRLVAGLAAVYDALDNDPGDAGATALAKQIEARLGLRIPIEWPFDEKEALRRQDGAAGALGLEKQVVIDLKDKVTMKLALIPPGKFSTRLPVGSGMGGPSADREALIRRAFFMGVTPVTQEQHRSVVGENPSRCKGDTCPVESISWDDAMKFCKQLSSKSGRRFRLPNADEWDDACRAGTATRFYFGDDALKASDYGWFREDSGNQTHPVAQKKPNAWGLYDMLGNVANVCAGVRVDPSSPSSNNTGPLVCGLPFRGVLSRITVMPRMPATRAPRAPVYGFRVVMDLPSGGSATQPDGP